MNRKFPFLAVSILATISGCGGGSASTPPPPPPPAIVVTLVTMPPTVIVSGGTASVAARVDNDAASGGVKWSCTPAATCGSFNPTSTASAVATVYSAPAATPSGGKINIIATSASDASKSASTQVVISGTASNATLKGQYAFLITAPTGNPVSRGNTTFAGSVNLDGKGNVLGGMEDIVSTKYYDQADPILATTADPRSTYSVDSSGHGTMTIQTKNGETLHFSFILTSASHAVVIETGGDPGSGTLDLQSGNFTLAQISGAYAFTMDGVDPAVPPAARLSFGGVFSADGTGIITGGTLDVNSNGTVTSQALTPNGGRVYQGPDTNGRGRLSMIPGAATSRSFTFYMVSPKVLRLFEDDNVDLMGGSAYAQGAAPMTLSGRFVYQHEGWSSTGRTVAAGQFIANGASSVTGGISDANVGGAAPTMTSLGKAVSGTFAIGANLAGTLNLTDAASTAMSTFNVYMVDPTINMLDPNNSSGGGGALLLHTDANINGTGMLIPQTISAPPAIVANQALNLRNCIAASTPNELDLVGVVSSDGSGKFVNGLADYDQSNSVNPMTVTGAPFTGSFMMDSANAGRFTGSFSIPMPTGGYPFIPPSATSLNISIYQASDSQALVIQTDNTANISGYLVQQRLP